MQTARDEAWNGVKACPAAILRCPNSGAAVTLLSPAELRETNRAIEQGTLQRLDGSLLGPLQAGFRTANGQYVYEVRDGIVLMLPATAITKAADAAAPVQHKQQQRVQNFYDGGGWERNEQGDFADAEIWEDLREVSREYVRNCHLRLNEHLPAQGQYLVDVASGPVQYEEYLSYHKNFVARVCVDISIAALREAKKKVGSRGIYILGDITNLPLRSGMADAVLSLHTLFHVPAEKQADAVQEVQRVLAPGASALIVYNRRMLLEKLQLLPGKILHAPFRLLAKRRARKAAGDKPKLTKQHMYFHAHPHRWFAAQDWPCEMSVTVWRSVSVTWLKTYIQPWLAGKTLLRGLYALENRYPHLLGRIGSYPLMIFRKPQAEAGSVRKAA